MQARKQPPLILALLHLLTLSLCIPASLIIFFQGATSLRFLLLILMLFYLHFFITKNVADIIVDGLGINSRRYALIHSIPKSHSPVKRRINYQKSPTFERQPQQSVLETSRNQDSFSAHDLSNQMLRSISRSRYHALKQQHSGQRENSSGFYIGQLLSEQPSLSRSFSSTEEGFWMRTRDNERMPQFQASQRQLQEKWHYTLSFYHLNKNQIALTYQKLRKYIISILSGLIRDQEAIIKSAVELMETTFMIKACKEDKIVTYKEKMIRIETTQVILGYFMRIAQKKSTIGQIPFRKQQEKDLEVFYQNVKRINEKLAEIDDQLGLPIIKSSSTAEQIREQVQERKELIKQFTEYMQSYEKGIDQERYQHQSQFYKVRIRLLRLLIRKSNELLSKNQKKLILKDRLNFRKAAEQQNGQFQIFLAIGYDNAVPHYDLRKIDNNSVLHCQPGSMNYLSAFTVYLFEVARNQSKLRRNDKFRNFLYLVAGQLSSL